MVDKTSAVIVCPEHKGVDLDPALGAAPDLFQGLPNNAFVEKGGTPAAVDPTSLIQTGCRRLTIRDQDDLLVGRFLRTQQLACKTQRLFDIRPMLHEIGDGHDGREILSLYHLRIGAESNQVQGVLGKFGFNQALQCEGNLFPCMQGVVHEHGIADIDEKDRLGIRSELLALYDKVRWTDGYGNSLVSPLHRVLYGLTDIHVERVPKNVFFGLFQQRPLISQLGGVVSAPAVLVEHLKDFSQGLIAYLPHTLWGQFQALPGLHQVALFDHHLLYALEVLEMFVGLFSQQLADLRQVQVGQVSHAPLSPPEKLLKPPHLTQDLPRFPHPHLLRPAKGILVQKLFEVLHLGEGFAELVQLFLAQGVQVLQKIIQVLRSGVQHVG